MKLTPSQAEEIISELQAVQDHDNAVSFWNDYPEYRDGRTLDEYLSYRSTPEYGDDFEAGSVNWDDISDGTVSGHKVVLVEDVGGEGQGDYAHIIVQVDSQIFKRQGWYASYDGTNWDEYETVEIEPYEVTVTKYREVK